MKLYFFLAALFITTSTFAQTISGKVVDEQSEPVVGAAIMLLQLPDSTLIGSALTDNHGNFNLNKQGDIIVISYLGYKPKMLKASGNIGIIGLEVNPLQTSEVIVTAESKLRREGNRFVLPAVYASPFAQGRDIWEFLKFAPMLKVSDNTISILGRDPATILINGRRTNMSASDVQQMLKGTQSQDVEKIEILPTPGSSFRANEQQGVVNIILKRGANEGFRGAVKIEDNQQFYNGQSVVASFNYNSKKLFLTSGVNFSNSPYYAENQSTGDYFTSNQQVNTFEKTNQRTLRFGGYLNLDYAIDKRSTIGAYLGAMFRDKKQIGNTITDYLTVGNPISDSTDFAHTDNRTMFLNSSVFANLHYDFKADDKGSVLKLDADYYHGVSKRTEHNLYTRRYNSGVVTPISDFMVSPASITDYYSLKIGYNHKFNSDHTLNVGAEAYGSTNFNDYFYGNNVGGNYISDPRRTNNFLYDEIVGAAYLEYSAFWSDKWETILGVRMETSHSKSNQTATNEINYRHNTDIFPSLSVTYIPSDVHILSLDLNTGIHRPGFLMLNPFVQYISPTHYIQNNPYLKPAKSYGALLSYTFLDDYTFSADYEYSKDNWTEFDILTDGNIIKTTRANYDHSHMLTLSFDVSKKLLDNYLTLNGSVGAEYDYEKGQVEDFVVNTANWSFFVDVKANIALSKKSKWNMQLKYEYWSPQTWATKSFNASNKLSASISKQFKNRSTLNFGVNNIIEPTWDKSYVYQRDYTYFSMNRKFRYYWISYTIPFGNQKVKSNRVRSDIRRME